MIGKLRDLLRLSDGEWLLSFVIRDDPRSLLEKIREDVLSIDIKKLSRKRTKTANDFMWAMCSDIGRSLTPPISKEEVYRTAIRDVGVYEPLPIKEEAIERFTKSWSSHGIGWVVEVVDDSKFEGYKKVHAYYGTSTYTTDEIRVIIEYLKQEMINLDLPIPLGKHEEERVLAAWGKA